MGLQRRCIRNPALVQQISDRIESLDPLTTYSGDGDLRLVIQLEYDDLSVSTLGVEKFCSWLRRDGRQYHFDPVLMRLVASQLSREERAEIRKGPGKNCGLGPNDEDLQPASVEGSPPCACDYSSPGEGGK